MSSFRRKLMQSPQSIVNETVLESEGTPGILFQGLNSAGASSGAESEIVSYAVIGFEGGNAPADFDGYNNNSTLILKIPSFHNGKPVTELRVLNDNNVSAYKDWKTFKKIQFGLNMAYVATRSLACVDSEEIYFPSSIKELNRGGRTSQTSLDGEFKKIYFNAENANCTYESESKNSSFEVWRIARYSDLEVYIGNKVKRVPNGLFYDLLPKLKVKFVENSICTGIGLDAFRESRLVTIKFPVSLQTISSKAFYGCQKLLNVNLVNTALSSIGEQVFSGCSMLYALSLPQSLQTVSTNAFGTAKIVQIRNLSTAFSLVAGGKEGEVLADKTSKFHTKLSFEDDFLFLLTGTHKYLFGYTGTATTLDTSMYDYDSIYDFALPGTMNGGQEIESIIFPNTLKYIGVSAFSWNNLTTVNIPKSVRRIEKSAFDTGFTNVTIGDDTGSDCEYIGDRAFSGSKSNEVIFKGKNAPELGADVFDTRYIKSIKIPVGSMASYQNGIGWTNYVSLLQEV